MSQIMKAFTGVFFIMLMLCSSIGVLNGFLQTLHAQNMHGAMIEELENSDYARTVIEECFTVIEPYGYELEITLYSEKDGVIVCKDSLSIPESCEGIYMAEVELKYHLKIDFFGINISQKQFGYGR